MMTQNEAKIRDGIKVLCSRRYEVVSGTVITGSLDTETYVVDVLQTDCALTIKGVALNVCSSEQNGLILIPEDGSNVVIGSIDGPGEWTILKTSRVAKVLFKAGDVSYVIDDSKISLKNGEVILDMGSSVFKINTASESLYSILSDLINGILALTVGTPSGPSTIPANAGTFSALLSRLNNLLSS